MKLIKACFLSAFLSVVLSVFLSCILFLLGLHAERTLLMLAALAARQKALMLGLACPLSTNETRERK